MSLNPIFGYFLKLCIVLLLGLIAVRIFTEGIVPTQDVAALIIILIVILVNKTREFLIDWSPMFLFVYFYEFVRGQANAIQNMFNISVNASGLFEADKLFFGDKIPVIMAQSLIQTEPTIIDYISLFWYTSFFWLPALLAAVLWIRSRMDFKYFRNAYVALTFGALLTFIVFPASPPWMTSRAGLMQPLITSTWQRLWLGNLTLGIFDSVGYNKVAPFPSLHIGCSVLLAFFCDYFAKKKIGGFSKLFYLYPAVMAFVVTYTSDHYVIDIVGGIVYAVVAILIATHIKNIKGSAFPTFDALIKKLSGLLPQKSTQEKYK